MSRDESTSATASRRTDGPLIAAQGLRKMYGPITAVADLLTTVRAPH